MNSRTYSTAWLRYVALPVLLMVLAATVGIATASLRPVDVTTQSAPRVCFPAAKWDAPTYGSAPCARIVRLYEDGSVRVVVSDVDGTFRWAEGIGAKDR